MMFTKKDEHYFKDAQAIIVLLVINLIISVWKKNESGESCNCLRKLLYNCRGKAKKLRDILGPQENKK